MRCGISYTNISRIEKAWTQPWRHFHNLEHLSSILDKIQKVSGLNQNELDQLICAAFFHDVQYLPWDSENNEDASIAIFTGAVTNKDKSFIDGVCDLIEVTKSRKVPSKSDKLKYIFWTADNDVLIKSNIIDLISYEHKIFKEYQFVDYSIYKEKRIQFLKTCVDLNTNILNLIEYINNRIVNIGVYAGSFNPLTIGHLNIIEKAEKIFDKVIIARGINPTKGKPDFLIPTDWRQIEEYTGLITNYIKQKESKNTNITLIRGLRNGDDLDYEVNQLRHIEKLKSDIKTIFINCDKNVEEISSTAVRSMLCIDDYDAIKLANSYIYDGIKKHLVIF